jgi:dienelactone hydrolase
MHKSALYVVSLILFMAGVTYGDQLLPYAQFGELHIYAPPRNAKDFAILVSGDGGWKHAAPLVAQELSKEGMFVAGVEIKKYLHGTKNKNEGCVSVAQDLQRLADFIRDRYDLHTGKTILLGYSSGATLVYAALAQASPGEFSGAVSFGFCADFEPAVDFCSGNGLDYVKGSIPHSIVLQPSKAIQDPWITFQGSIDEVCDPQKTREFTSEIRTGEFILIPKAGHGFAHLQGWLPEFRRILPRFHNG